ncbi:MAG TPA: MFS transporter [Daejeonella sp.]|nr:MFS transporter [Daejeonella sp.]
MRILTRTVWILSVVSLLTDVSSEMLYPVMPVYLRHIGFSIALIGVLEGCAEALAGLSKGYFGKLSDQTGKRMPFVQAGYFLSAISKPMMVAFIYPWWIFIARSIDRLGKGLRTGARDAVLSDESSAANKARVFGFHRSMDTTGAVVGPALALLFLYLYPGNYVVLFLLAFIPGLLGVLITFFLKEKPLERASTADAGFFSFFSFIRYWKESSPAYRHLLRGLLAFAIINSSDVFLLLMMKEQGLSDTAVIGTYIFYNLVYALSAYPAGIIADQIGRKRILIAGFFIFMLTYLGMAFNTTNAGFFLIFLLYGVYAACTEGTSKAMISNISDRKDTATAIGTFSAFSSLCTLIASSVAGLLWYQFGPRALFLFSASGAFVVICYFLIDRYLSQSLYGENAEI